MASREKVAKGFGAVLPLLGLGGQIATAVPGLKKPPKVVPNVPGYEASSIPAGVAAQGHGMGRGPALMAAFRAAGDTGQKLAAQKAKADYYADALNTQNELARRDKIAAFGVGMAGGMADFGVGLVDVANARTAERLAAQKETASALPEPGDMSLQAPGDLQQPTVQDVAANPYSLQSALLSPLMQATEEQVQRDIRNKSEALIQSRASLGIPDPELQLRIAPEMQEMASQFNISMDLIDKEGLDMTLALPQLTRRIGLNALDFLNPPMRMLNEDLSLQDSEAAGGGK
jgi:hypothetical protein